MEKSQWSHYIEFWYWYQVVSVFWYTFLLSRESLLILSDWSVRFLISTATLTISILFILCALFFHINWSKQGLWWRAVKETVERRMQMAPSQVPLMEMLTTLDHPHQRWTVFHAYVKDWNLVPKNWIIVSVYDVKYVHGNTTTTHLVWMCMLDGILKSLFVGVAKYPNVSVGSNILEMRRVVSVPSARVMEFRTMTHIGVMY